MIVPTDGNGRLCIWEILCDFCSRDSMGPQLFWGQKLEYSHFFSLFNRISPFERLFLLVSVWCPIFCSSFKIRQIMQPHWLCRLLDGLDTQKNVCPHCVRWVTNKAVILPFRDVGSIPPFYAIHKRRLCCITTTTKPLRFPPSCIVKVKQDFY